MLIDSRLGAATCRIAILLVMVLLATLTRVAVMLVVPRATEVAEPVELTVATPVTELTQVTLPVMLEVPLVKVPMAVYCWVNPRGIEAQAGVTAIDCSRAGFTVKQAPWAGLVMVAPSLLTIEAVI